MSENALNVNFGVWLVYFFFCHPSSAVVSKERQYTQAQGSFQLHAIVFHVGYKATRGHYTTCIVDDNEDSSGILYLDDEKIFNLNPSSQVDLLGTHKPFDVGAGRFQMPKPEREGDIPPSIAEQPRTPYLLLYTSCFE